MNRDVEALAAIYVRVRVGLALALLAPDDAEVAAALEQEAEAVNRLTTALERLSTRMHGPPPPAGAS